MQDKQSQMDFFDANDILLSIIKNIRIGIIAFENDGKVLIANELAEEHLGVAFTPQSNVIETFSILPELAHEIELSLKNGRSPFVLENLYFDNKYLDVKGNPIKQGMIISIEDVTNKIESEQYALEALLKGQEDERKRIAKEIHDGVGPMLSAVKMHVEAVQRDIGISDSKNLAKLDTTYHLIDTLANDLRSLSHDLMPKIVEDFGLVEALDYLSKNLSSESFEIEFHHNMEDVRYPKNIELNIYRIAQELVHNSLKHSGGDRVVIQLLEHSKSLVLMVEDNGKGMHVKDEQDYGLGIKNIETRVKAMGGDFIFDSVPNAGVTATIEISR